VRSLVIGCGRVGAGVARDLAARDGEVVVLDRDPTALDRLGEGFPGRKVVGSALDRRALVRAGIEEADAVAVVTGDDALNAAVALLARRRFRVPTVVARVYDPRTAVIHQRLGIRAVSPVTWGIQRIAELTAGSHLTATTTLGAGDVELVEVRVPALLDGRPVTELEVAGEITVVALTHHGRTRLPARATRLHDGDLAVVAVTTAAQGRLATLLAQR
jgi:trk system potassium uptake protein